ncbi:MULTISPECIES: bifunctional glutamate N-acetyltransferase/amino-acid acetyltransferase ArgJ [Clostridium]|uniref:bifunctional glutamate N-acetyltransferase/amino-acid acetyltransferase ArgJ n=1 Tax=Clostridium TaxID=1485 RepID=UPI0004D455EB|nr:MULTISPECIES: bifunctional glutamate N-acetyltransferase/amino-acid acetyltransferase ArgJ [Clostridium]KEH89384.1 arginine biosynthesis protein ArgJ [Clostridium novyi A str. 4540]KEH92947.1 arginine biosynthesis protein ArgJ [Clostridium botulinum C/D str. It1]
MKILENKNLTDVPYFKATGVSCGLKKNSKKDICLIYSEKPAVSAATFTKNKMKAAPIIVDMEKITFENTQAIIVNSGYANACTGKQGLENANNMCEITAKYLNLCKNDVLVCSTGVIGEQLPMKNIENGIKNACDSLEYGNANDAAEAIKTTDTFIKKLTLEVEIDNKKVLISAIAKGSGMIHPNMGTMLSFIVTDASISKKMLSKALKESVEDSYNMISVDGDTSTNDSVIILANGAANNNKISNESEDYIKFKNALDFLNKEIAKMIAKDGEGATKLLECTILNSRTLKDAKKCAKSVIKSSLVKSAIYGNDANWGRILCAIGYSEADFNINNIDVSIKNSKQYLEIVKGSVGVEFNENLAKDIIDSEYVNITIDLHDGSFSATSWGCDLTYNYIKINASYRS